MHLRTDLVQEKYLSKNSKLTTRLKNKTWTNPQIKDRNKSHELRLIRPQIQHKNPENMYLKLTPLTPSVEKIVKLQDFK